MRKVSFAFIVKFEPMRSSADINRLLIKTHFKRYLVTVILFLVWSLTDDIEDRRARVEETRS